MSGNLYQFTDVKQKIKDNAITILIYPINKNILNTYVTGTILVARKYSSEQSQFLFLTELKLQWW